MPRLINASNSFTAQSQTPMFRAYGSATGWTTITNGSATKGAFDTASHNVGGHYDTTNRRFTAPSHGNYLFTCHIYGRLAGSQGDNTNYWWARFYKNSVAQDSSMIMGYQNAGDYDAGCAYATMFFLNPGDYIELYVRANGAPNGEIYYNNSWFNGTMIP